MQILKSKMKVPPGGWTYTIESGTSFRGTTLERLVDEVREYYFTNDQLPPKDLDMLIQDQICSKIPDAEAKCYDATPPTFGELIKRAGTALVNFSRSGFEVVPDEVLVERRAICLECPLWKGESFFGVGRCGACGCSGFKLYAASERCPKDKWTTYST